MTTEEIAARYSDEPGYSLIDVAEVALPIWSIEVEALVMAKKEVPLVDEFILRTISAGLGSVSQLSGFLGLNEKFLRRRVMGLNSTDCVRYGGPQDTFGPSLRLTSKGEGSLRTLESVTARREVLTYLYDGITRHLIAIPRGDDSLQRPREARAWNLVQIPPLPALPPSDEELRNQDFTSCIPSRVRKRLRIHQVLSLERIGQRKKLFREARMLVYRGSSNADLKVSFFSVYGRPLPEIDEAFAKNGGIQKLNLPRQIKESQEDWANLKDEPVVRAGIEADSRMTPEARRKVEVAAKESTLISSKISETETRLRDPESEDEAALLKKEVQELKKQLAEAEKAQSQPEVRRLTVYEHPAVLDRALRDAKERMMLVSPWINDDVMTPRRIEEIHVLAARKVKVYIGYGIDETNHKRGGKEKDPEDTNAYRDLKALTLRYPNLRLVRLGNTHAKMLLMDSEFVVVGSFNWMSFKGDKNRPFREEISFMSTNAKTVDQEFECFLERFESTERPQSSPRAQRSKRRGARH